MYYLGTEKQCNDYNNEVSLKENYQPPTTCWAGAIKCVDGYAILKHPNYESSTMKLVETLNLEQFEEN